MHSFFRALGALMLVHTTAAFAIVGVMAYGVFKGDPELISRYQLSLLGLCFAVRVVGHVVLENVMQKTSGVFRSIPATRRMDTLTMLDQFVTCFSWIPMALWVNGFLLVNPVSYSNVVFSPAARYCAAICVIDLITELYRNPPRGLYVHHAVAITMLLASFEFLPVAYSDTGVMLYSVQSALDRASYLVFFWGRMRGCADRAKSTPSPPLQLDPAGEAPPTTTELSPKLSLRFSAIQGAVAKSSSTFSNESSSGTYSSPGDFTREISTPSNNALLVPDQRKGEDVSLDDLIPAAHALRKQFTVTFVYYTFLVRGLMLVSTWIYLHRNWDNIPSCWRVAHLVLPWMFNAADWHLYQHLYQRSTLCRKKYVHKEE